MSKKLGLIVLVILALTLSLSACEKPASTLPTPTAKNKVKQPQAAATGVGMGMIEIAASQTAAALTNVPLGTPALIVNGTATATPPGGIPQIVTPTGTHASSVDTALPSLTPGIINTALPPQPTVQINKPATYTLKEGEFVYCLARRFNVDPDQMLSLNGLIDSETIYAGLTVKIPTSGSFPGQRALKVHPATYTVQADDSIYSVACLYGDVDPINIAAVNGLAAPYNLTTGVQIRIP